MARQAIRTHLRSMVPCRVGQTEQSHVFWRSVAWIERVVRYDGTPAEHLAASSCREDILDLLNGWRQVAGLPPSDVPQQSFDFESFVVEVQSMRDGGDLSRSVEDLDIDLSLFDMGLVMENYCPETVIKQARSDHVAHSSWASLVSNEGGRSPFPRTRRLKRRRPLSPRPSSTTAPSGGSHVGDGVAFGLTGPEVKHYLLPSNAATSSRSSPARSGSDSHPDDSCRSDIRNPPAFSPRDCLGSHAISMQERPQSTLPKEHENPLSCPLDLPEHTAVGDDHNPAVSHQTPRFDLSNSLGLYDERHPLHSSSSQVGLNGSLDITHSQPNAHTREPVQLQPSSEAGWPQYGPRQTQHSGAQPNNLTWPRDIQAPTRAVEDQGMNSDDGEAAEVALQDRQQDQHDVMEYDDGAREQGDVGGSERENEAMDIDSGEHCGLNSK